MERNTGHGKLGGAAAREGRSGGFTLLELLLSMTILSIVVVGMADPNPIAAGGARRLRQAGLRVLFAADPTPFQIQNEGWLHLIRTGRPFTRV